MRKQLYIIAYDITEDKSRYTVADLIETEGGKRINLSVFECMLSKADKKRLLGKIHPYIDPKTDIVVCYHVCTACYIKSVFIPELPSERHFKGIVVV